MNKQRFKLGILDISCEKQEMNLELLTSVLFLENRKNTPAECVEVRICCDLCAICCGYCMAHHSPFILCMNSKILEAVCDKMKMYKIK